MMFLKHLGNVTDTHRLGKGDGSSMFTVDTDRGLYLFLALGTEPKKYIATPTDKRTVVDMVDGKLTMRNAFLKNNEFFEVEADGVDWVVSPTALEDGMLPERGAFLGEVSEDVTKYIDKLKDELSKERVTLNGMSLSELMDMYMKGNRHYGCSVCLHRKECCQVYPDNPMTECPLYPLGGDDVDVMELVMALLDRLIGI